ncbi:MAG: putative membrane protein [Cenarchaeum symbiont of Oopsacas minuta]|nr:putative membrane protein [Cenarchaeum symbiont of Oopsacas minuta]
MTGTRTVIIFMFFMWALILLEGGIIKHAIDFAAISGYGDIGNLIVKSLLIIGFVIVWIFVLSKLKNIIFNKQILR